MHDLKAIVVALQQNKPAKVATSHTHQAETPQGASSASDAPVTPAPKHHVARTRKPAKVATHHENSGR